MSNHWGLIREDDSTGDDTADEFNSEPWDVCQMDLLLVGKDQGPIFQLIDSLGEDEIVDHDALKKTGWPTSEDQKDSGSVRKNIRQRRSDIT